MLRAVGRDTLRVTGDVAQALVEAGVVPKAPTSKRALATVQDAINGWALESGLSLGAVSVVLACSTGETYQL